MQAFDLSIEHCVEHCIEHRNEQRSTGGYGLPAEFQEPAIELEPVTPWP